ncbi:MAG: D-alanyl-D-alanine carboxypeptidase [Armatimonadota bacterium]|nr:D-alanyl-D-alanine carboxypeptidase [Armatimonadota bacterium]
MVRRAAVLALVLGLGLDLPVGPAAARLPLRAEAVALVDVSSGRLLYGQAADRRMAPASTTKILTAALAIEKLPPGAVITVGPGAAAMRRGSTLGLAAGERWAADDLLHALLLVSANDAAIALAEATAGTVRRFVALMNARARALGARSSHFSNPHGLDSEDHYTTARDLALIARYALGSPRFRAIVRTETWQVRRWGLPAEQLVNRNQFLARYQGADGVKTGMTAAAGYTFVASATRDGRQLVAVVLRSPDIYGDAERLMDFGFQLYPRPSSP